MSLCEHALSLFRSAVGTVRPAPMLKRALKLQGEGCPQLLVNSRAFPLKRGLYLVVAGLPGMASSSDDGELGGGGAMVVRVRGAAWC